MTDPYPHAGRGRHGAPASRAPRRGKRLRPLVLIPAAGLAAAVATVAALAGAGTFRPGHIVVHGTEQVVVNSFDGMSAEQAFPDITSGTRVTVVDQSGTVIGTSTLAASDPSSWGQQAAVYSFVVTVPAGEPRYGIEIGRNRGTVWFTEDQLRRGPALSAVG